MYQFNSDEDVVGKAREILTNRAYIKPDAKQFFNGEEDSAVRAMIALDMAGYDIEHFNAYYFGPQGQFLGKNEICKGTERMVPALTREVCRQGLLKNATFVVIAHNHPSGDTKPSKEDRNVAMETAEACHVVGIIFSAAYVVGGPRAEDVKDVPPPDDVLQSVANPFVDILKGIRPH